MLSNGCIIEGHVERSVISPGVYVAPGAVVLDSVIMTDTVVGENAVVDRAIIDEGVSIGDGAHVGFGDDNTPNLQVPKQLNTGLTLVGRKAQIPHETIIGHNVIINPDTRLRRKEIGSGETV